MKDVSTLPVALFDSGMGGLTVLKALSRRLPAEDLLYLGDTARLPYGTKGAATIVRYTLKAAQKLVDSGVKMLVVACNTATAAALPQLRERFWPLPVLGVVEPGALAAARASRNGEIVVIGTEATISGGAYQRAIARIRPEAHVLGRACTLFVPLAEEGWMDGPLVEGIARRYLADIFSPAVTAARPDTLLLGCTHFPLLQTALQQVVGPQVRIVDSAATTAESVEAELTRLNLLRRGGVGHCRFLTTDNQSRFARTGSLFLERPLKTAEVELVDI
ncbi:glutamate racemase [Desulfovibrio sp. ZJ369]|uniref:glutamate racemase n=1 Tax=Desulfovibrio sp. ZJ369 TaxID=2709793 RepID=UPI0013EDD257|nr:glutamate racemase [Desulfovibrio sp. ZJ369]